MTSNFKIIKNEKFAANESQPEKTYADPVEALLNVLGDTIWSAQRHRQHNAWEACLCSLILGLDPTIRTVQVSEAIPYGSESLDRVGFSNTMANLGYTCKTIYTNLKDVDKRIMPCMFIPLDHPESPAILFADGHIYQGKQRETRSLDHKHDLKGKVVIFRRTDSLDDQTSRLSRSATQFSWFRALVDRFHSTSLNILITGLILNIIGLSTPLFIMLVYDRVISTHALNVLPWLAIGVGIALIAEWALRAIRSKSLSWLGGRVDNIVSNMIFDHLLHLAPSYIERASIPSQIARIKTFESIRDFFSGAMFLSVMELPFMIIALVAIGVIAGPLVVVPIGMSVIYLTLFYFIWRKVRVAIRTAAKASSARQQFSLETIEKVEAIRANALTEIWGEKFRELSGREALAQFQLGWYGMVGETFANALTVMSAVAVVSFGVHFIWAGEMTTGGLVATMILVWRVLGPFYSLCTMVPRLEQLRNSIRQVNNLMDVDTEEMSAQGLARPGRLKGRVTFAGATLKYNSSADPIIAGLTIEAAPGDIVAITGENGSGKTTLLKMIKGLYLPQNGSLRLDGFDMRQLNPHDVRRNIAYIPQTPDFFPGTIAENLRFGNPLASEGEIRQALGQARVLDEVMALPEGIQTVIGGNDGIRLSSTLAARLSMVRAYLQDAPILLIDELPNTLLTDESGQFLHDTIMRHKGTQTVFIVTYREDFLNMADTIVFLRRGFVPQSGTGRMMTERLKKSLW